MDNVTILVIEDDSALRELWRRAFQTSGCDVLSAANLSDALAQINKPDMVLLDWYLDHETADLFLDRWVAERGAPLMVLSGKELPAEDLYTRGAWHVLVKPIGLEVLMCIVQRYRYYIELQRTVDRLVSDVTKMKRLLVVLIGVAVLGLTNVEWLLEIVKGLI